MLVVGKAFALDAGAVLAFWVGFGFTGDFALVLGTLAGVGGVAPAFFAACAINLAILGA